MADRSGQERPGAAYSIARLALRWGVATRTIRRWIALGVLRSRRLGPRLVRVSAGEVARFERMPTGPGAPAA